MHLSDFTRQAIQAERTVRDMVEQKRDQLRAEGYRLAEFTNMFERWVHADGREVILE